MVVVVLVAFDVAVVAAAVAIAVEALMKWQTKCEMRRCHGEGFLIDEWNRYPYVSFSGKEVKLV